VDNTYKSNKLHGLEICLCCKEIEFFKHPFWIGRVHDKLKLNYSYDLYELVII